MGYPKQELVPRTSFLYFGEVTGAEVTVERYHRVLAFLELLGDALWVN